MGQESRSPSRGTRSVARMLRKFDVFSAGDIRIADKVVKGYRRAAFLDAWSRYVPNPADSASEAQHRNNANKNGPQIPIFGSATTTTM